MRNTVPLTEYARLITLTIYVWHRTRCDGEAGGEPWPQPTITEVLASVEEAGARCDYWRERGRAPFPWPFDGEGEGRIASVVLRVPGEARPRVLYDT